MSEGIKFRCTKCKSTYETNFVGASCTCGGHYERVEDYGDINN